MKKLLFALLCAVAVTTLQTSSAFAVKPFDIYQDSTLNQVLQRNKLVVGMEVEYFPFEYADENGAPMGFDVDLARLIAQELGVEIEIKDIEWTGLIPSLQGGKVDMVISGMTRTLERMQSIGFTDPYFVTGLCVLLNKDKAAGVDHALDLNASGRIIAVKTGTTGDIVATDKFPKAEIRRYKDETACVREVVTGRADAFFYDQLSIAKHHNQNPGSTTALLKPFTYEPFAIAVRKGEYDFTQWLNVFLQTVKMDGRYDELHRRHFKDILN